MPPAAAFRPAPLPVGAERPLPAGDEPAGAPAPDHQGRAGRWPAHWPLTLLLLGIPLWWVIGLISLMPLMLAVPMAWQLRRRRTLLVPPGITLWLLFLAWVLLGALVLWADAPGAEPGGGRARLLVFGYRAAWYGACTIIMLWIGNLDRRVLTDRRVHLLIGWVFVVATAGGLLALAAPTLEFDTAIELLLPHGLRSNSFVASLVHAEAADVQMVLGRPETRPKAPFAFTNTWGSCLSLGLVFLVAGLSRCRPPIRYAGWLVIAVAVVPVVYSLNRGLWASLALGVLLLALIQLGRGHLTALLALLTASAIGAGLLLASPLGDLYQDRLDNQHSNDRRGQLLGATVTSMSEGSPVIGFGSTRDVQGSFASISGGATPTCPACGVPPLGTQGQLWLLLFAQGWLGATFFLLFVALALARCWRCRTLNETLCTFVLLFFAVQLPIYDTLGLPLLMVMAAIGLVWREQRCATRRPMAGGWVPLGTAGRTLLVGSMLIGALVGWLTFGPSEGPRYATTVGVALTPVPVYLDTGQAAALSGATAGEFAPPSESTVDTEAALLVAERPLSRAALVAGEPPDRLRREISITAEPLSNVLEITVDGPDAAQTARSAQAVVDSYLIERRQFLDGQRQALLVRLQEELTRVHPTSAALADTRRYLRDAIAHLSTFQPVVGEVVRAGFPRAERAQVEVPIGSGAALGLLAGCIVLPVVRPRRPRRPR